MSVNNGVRIVAAAAALLAITAVPATAATSAAAAPPVAATGLSVDLGLHLGGKPSQQQIAALFQQWNAALATGQPTVVADLYTPGAVLLPTLSNEVRTSRAAILDYFKSFLAKGPSGRILSSTVTVLDRDTAMNNGTYLFTFKDGSTAQARFTYVYEKVGGRWLIAAHHSSAMPEK
ncbi:SgcJ/EcaC family oxidoreductase [Crossiella sp. CA-258035]|uniref:SgcJ/EcaC family oxidoreductase n=1 Tax=Crossiella sp. CA-258035 TaxID=2981138 RepID=UPI0024BD2378|nr:SgcJ/EcaC family oxidoreductase [Crossiella sp. CA-258035]WHT22732.1 SgcJ/EcaC family oxidoreductase [Crossiella sp. CA-258035]